MLEHISGNEAYFAVLDGDSTIGVALLHDEGAIACDLTCFGDSYDLLFATTCFFDDFDRARINTIQVKRGRAFVEKCFSSFIAYTGFACIDIVDFLGSAEFY